MTAAEPHTGNYLHQSSVTLSSSDGMDEEESAESLLASVKEQEQQFALLSKEIEEERKSVAKQLKTNKSSFHSNGNSNKIYETPQDDYVTKSFSHTEDYDEPQEETEIYIDENGVPTSITKRIVTKTVTERKIREIRDPGSLQRNNHHLHSKHSEIGEEPHYVNAQYASITRNNYDSRPYEKEALLQQRTSSSDSDRIPRTFVYTPVKQKAARSQIQPENFQPEDYGLEDDRNSDSPNDDIIDYGLSPAYNKPDRRSTSSAGSSLETYENQIDSHYESESAPETTRPKAPLAFQEASSTVSLDKIDSDWKIPSLKEVIEMLSYNMPVVQQNAAAYLQHLSYCDDETKTNVRKLGGISALIKLLPNENIPLVSNACGCLRNLSYGKRNDRNKLTMKQNDGVPALVKLFRSIKNSDIREQATGTLWNLSAHADLKGQVLELGLEPLADLIIGPYADMTSHPDSKLQDIVLVDVFTNATGIVRNLSSADSDACRQKIRQCNGLLPALISVLRTSVESGVVDTKANENCLCILRNLTYKLQDETPNWKELYSFTEPLPKPTKNSSLVCFGKKGNNETILELVDEIPPDYPDATGAQLLWQPELTRLYVNLLKETSSEDIVEATLGALQNLTYGIWKWAVYSRIIVRREKGLPRIIDQLQTNHEYIVRFAAIATSNLTEDPKNKELLGKFAMNNLLLKLPDSPNPHTDLSDVTLIAVLNCIRMLVDKHEENIKYFRDYGGVEKIAMINKLKDNGKFHARVVKAAGQVLKVVWANKASRSMLKKDGWNRDHFIPTITYDTLPRNAPPLSKHSSSFENPRSSYSRNATRREESLKAAAAAASAQDQNDSQPTTSRSFDPKSVADSWV